MEHSMEIQYSQFFSARCDGRTPYFWQRKLGEDSEIRNRLISIPTGFGKTLGVAFAWIYQRVVRQNPSWPRRLVWCLPMRTLVEQTAEILSKVTKDLSLSVNILMGGSDAGNYHLEPEKEAIFVGTQDMLISRALNRGYGTARARWPMEFALLNNDCLWVFDEIQLMDVSLITSVQMQQFRNEDYAKTSRPCYSWWMSATLQPEWFETPEAHDMLKTLKQDILTMQKEDETQPLWGQTKHIKLQTMQSENETSKLVFECAHTRGTVLLIVNTVKRAIAIYEQLIKNKSCSIPISLLHSRFRTHERKSWKHIFFNATNNAHPKIIIATQVIEAGIDISADILITELAPWTSLIQRFGRCARYGGEGTIYVLDLDTSKASNALPYTPEELSTAREHLTHLEDVSLTSLCEDEANLSPEERAALYPYRLEHQIVRHDLEALFDTTADLTGSDLDISRFIRSGRERDCSVFWCATSVSESLNMIQPHRDELCNIPVYELEALLKKQESNSSPAYIWNYLENKWDRYTSAALHPGRIIMLSPEHGGYSEIKGFTGNVKDKPTALSFDPPLSKDMRSDLAQDTDDLSQNAYQSISAHDAESVTWGIYLSQRLELSASLSKVLCLALSLHDIGKAHPRFQQMINRDELPETVLPPLAKAPENKWLPPENKLWIRHELASALALLELLSQTDYMHPAIFGELEDYLRCGLLKPPTSELHPSKFGKQLSALSKTEFNLLLYLVAAHHGKVRAALHATPNDQKHIRQCANQNIMPIRGIFEGDILPEMELMLPDHTIVKIPETTLHLDAANIGLSSRYGHSWSERIQALLSAFGPFQLAWVETLVRVADIQASKGTPIPK